MSAEILISPDFRLNLNSKQTFFYLRRYQPNGAIPQIAFPQPFKSWIARILHGAYQLNQVTNQSVSFVAVGGRNFVAWNLSEGEEICFDGAALVGFESTIKLHTIISFNISAICLQRMFFQAAKGPGVILFETKGIPETFHATDRVLFPPSRLVCWTSDSAFQIEASPNTLDHYFSSAYLKVVETGGLVIDADTANKSAGRFLWETLKRNYRPF